MRSKDFDPQQLDVAAFARAEGRLEGQWPLACLGRVAEEAHEDAPVGDTAVTWKAQGEQRNGPGAELQVWLHLGAHTVIGLECQRCLRPVRVELKIERAFRFERDESAAAAADLDSEEDVLALPRFLDLRTLVEDELLLALPLVPRHEDCEMPAAGPARGLDVNQPPVERPHPFAALADLKKTPKG